MEPLKYVSTLWYMIRSLLLRPYTFHWTTYAYVPDAFQPDLASSTQRHVPQPDNLVGNLSCDGMAGTYLICRHTHDLLW